MSLVLHQHLHAPHIRAPELQAVFHPFDLQGKPTITLTSQLLATLTLALKDKPLRFQTTPQKPTHPEKMLLDIFDHQKGNVRS